MDAYKQSWWSHYHQAPPEIAMLFDFVNTLDERTFGKHVVQDELADTAGLTNWLVTRDAIGPTEQATTSDFQLAVEIRTVFRSYLAENGFDPVAFGNTTPFQALPLHTAMNMSGQLELVSSLKGVRGALSQLLIQAVYAAMSGIWDRVKMCAAPDCRIVFFDHSKPRTAKWCDTFQCGNRIKTQRYRQRKQKSSI